MKLTKEPLEVCTSSREFCEQMAAHANEAGDLDDYRRWHDLAKWWRDREMFNRGRTALANKEDR